MSIVILFLISSFLGLVEGEVPVIIVNQKKLWNIKGLKIGNTFINHGTYFYNFNKSTYALDITCFSKHSAECKIQDTRIHRSNSFWPELNLHLKANNLSYNLNNIYRDLLIFYEYEDGDHLTMTCSQDSVSVKNSHLSFGNHKGYNESYTINERWRSSDDNRILECRVNSYDNKNKQWLSRRISILLRKVTLATTAATTTTTKGTSSKCDMYETIIIILGMSGVLLFSIPIVILLYKLKKMKLFVENLGVRNYESQQGNKETRTASSQSMVTYSVPKDQKAECMYSEPCKPDAGTTSELNYATLDMGKYPGNKIDTTNTIYSEIRHDVAMHPR